MDNYTMLLEEFHVHQIEQTSTHEFMVIIDQIRNAKKSKQKLIYRKIEQKGKLFHKSQKNHDSKNTLITNFVTNDSTLFQESRCLQQINNTTLRRQLEQLQKQVGTMKKHINQMESHLSVFKRKENQIEQLKYSSRRELQNVELNLKNHKTLTQQLQERNQKIIEQLQIQRANLVHENRFLADKLNETKLRTKNLIPLQSTIYLNDASRNTYIAESNLINFQKAKLQQIYTNKNLQEQLRILYVILALRNSWNQELKQKSLQIVKLNAEKHLKNHKQFRFMSKAELLMYYEQKMNITNFQNISQIIIRVFQLITQNAKKMQDNGNILNIKLKQLEEQYNYETKVLQNLQILHNLNAEQFVSSIQKQNISKKFEIILNSNIIFQILQRQFRLLHRLKGIKLTLQNLIKPKSARGDCEASTCTSQFGKLLGDLLPTKDKRNSAKIASSKQIISVQSSNSIHPLSSLQKTSSAIYGHKNLMLTKKNSHQNSKSFQSSSPLSQMTSSNILLHYQQILSRNSLQILFDWYETVKNGIEGINLLNTVLQNDLYRIFYGPTDYSPELSELQNQENCQNKTYESIYKMLVYFKTNLCLQIRSTLQQNKKMEQNNKSLPIQCISSYGQPKYVIQSKGYYRQDNFKLLQKIQLLQLKKKALYIPYQYGIDIDNQLLNSTRNQFKLPKCDQLREFSCRKQRKTVPYASNYISTSRQKLGKADRKIRDLLKNADTLRIKNRLAKSKQHFNFSKKSLQSQSFIN